MEKNTEVLVIGGGLAGLSCAFELAEKGKKVILAEARDVLGGRTSSWKEEDMTVESGLHRFLGFYELLPDLLKRAGADISDVVKWEDEMEIRLPDGGTVDQLDLSLLRKPFDTVSTLISNDLMDLKDKKDLLIFLKGGFDDYKKDPYALDKMSLREYAFKNGISDKLIRNILTPLSTGIFFLPIERYSAMHFFGLSAPFLKRIHKIGVGSFKGGMTEVMAEPLAAKIRQMGGEVLTGAEIKELLVSDKCVIGGRGIDLLIKAGTTVLASSISSAQRLIGQAFPLKDEFAGFLSLKTMPAVTIQLDLKEPALEHDISVFSPGTTLACYAEESRVTFPESSGRLSIILADPAKFIEMKDDEIFDEVKKDLLRVDIDLKDLVTRYTVIRIPADFYTMEPGNAHLIPGQKTSVPGLILAGDYTKQKYMANMEGAVESGRVAAELALAS